jgi:hypothetical protein
MVTAKFNRKRAAAALVALGAVLILVVLLSGRRSGSPGSALPGAVSGNAGRVAYLKALGWSVAEAALDEQDVVIPREFDGVYAKYNEIQKAQGFDLSLHGGSEAVRYTYKILNFPGGADDAVADIIVCRDEVIAGDVQSARIDGFMQGLKYPGKR